MTPLEPGAAPPESRSAPVRLPALSVAQPWHNSWPVKGLFTLALIVFLKYAEPVLTPVMVAVVLTFVFAPAVRALRRRGVPEYIGAGLLVIALLVVVGLIVSALVQPAIQWWERVPAMLTQLMAEIDRVRAALPFGGPGGAPRPGTSFRGAGGGDPLNERLATEGVALTGALLARILSFGVSAVATLILLYFLLASEHWMLSRTVEAIPRRRTRALLLSGVRSAQREIGRFLGTLALMYTGVGLVMMVALSAIGLPNPALWATLVAVVNFVPYLGPIAIVVLLLMAGLVSFVSGWMVLAPAGAFVVVHAVEANLVSPWFVGRRLTLSPLSVFLSIMFWGWLWGLAGAVFSVPLLVGMRSICKRYRGWRLMCIYMEGGQKAPPSLRSLLRVPRARIEAVPTSLDGHGPGHGSR